MQHLMIDLETLGTTPGSVIMQIGAASFNTNDADFKTFGCNVSIDSCLGVGMKIDGSTVRWWMKQAEAARLSLQSNPISIQEALEQLHTFFFNNCNADTLVWSHGLAFDLPMLDVAYNLCYKRPPWHHRNLRDTRTLAMLVPNVERPAPAIAHCAVDDALAQAAWVRSMLCASTAYDTPDAA